RHRRGADPRLGAGRHRPAGWRNASLLSMMLFEGSNGPAMDVKQTIAALAALAHENRLQLFRLLVRRGPEGLSAGAIAERLGILPSSLSFHLQQLVHAGLIRQVE